MSSVWKRKVTYRVRVKCLSNILNGLKWMHQIMRHTLIHNIYNCLTESIFDHLRFQSPAVPSSPQRWWCFYYKQQPQNNRYDIGLMTRRYRFSHSFTYRCARYEYGTWKLFSKSSASSKEIVLLYFLGLSWSSHSPWRNYVSWRLIVVLIVIKLKNGHCHINYIKMLYKKWFYTPQSNINGAFLTAQWY